MNVCRYMKLYAMKSKSYSTIKSSNTLNFNNSRMFATDAQNYFKRVRHDEKPPHKMDITTDFIEQTRVYNKFHEQQARAIVENQKHKTKLGIRDYELEDYRADGASANMPHYEDLVKGKIPQDMIEANRYELEIVDHLIPTLQVAAFNLPYDVSKQELMDVFENYGNVDNIEISHGLNGLPSHAVVTYKSHKSFEKCIKTTKGSWIRNKLLKLRTSVDAPTERIRDRTIVLSQVPEWAAERHVLKTLDRFGSVTKIDMPMTDKRIEEIKQNRSNPANERAVQKDYEKRMEHIDKILKEIHYTVYPESHFEQETESVESLKGSTNDTSTLAEKIMNFDKDLYKEQVVSKMMQAPTGDLKILDKEKRLKVLTLCTMVYNENQLVNDSIKNIKFERDSMVNRLNNVMEYPEIPGKAVSESFISAEQIQTLRSYLTYVDKNHDSLPPEIISEVRENKAFQVIKEYYSDRVNDKNSMLTNKELLEETMRTRISESQNVIMKELASGYQFLLQSLEKREKILKHRLDRLLKDYGTKDRIMFENKDFANELEDIEFDITRSPLSLTLEGVISVSEQMGNIKGWKEETDPFKMFNRQETALEYDTPNYGEHDVEHAKLTQRTQGLVKSRKIANGHEVDLHKVKNNQAIFNNFHDDVIFSIKARLDEARKNYDIPFDEMYHKEKALIDNVVKAEKELLEAQNAAQSQLENSTGSIEDLIDNNLMGLYEKEDDLRMLLKRDGANIDSADSFFSEKKRLSNNYKTLIKDLCGYNNIDKYLMQHYYMRNMGY